MFSSAAQHTFTISDFVAARIYSDTKPKIMKTANLQKGIILLYNGREVVGEGMGFGAPIAKYSDETVFSGSSLLGVHRRKDFVVIRKEFSMDLIARDQFRSLKLENKQLRSMIDFVSLFYQKNKWIARFIIFTQGLLSKFGVKSIFDKTTPKGKVILTCMIKKNLIDLNLDISQLDRQRLEKVFVLNEQGAHFFKKYFDSDGLNLYDDKIGFWDSVTAQYAKIADEQGRIGFKLKNIKGTLLRRGRELVEGSLDWIGLDYEINAHRDSFEYEIEVFG